MNFFEDFPKPEPVERPKSVKFVPPPWAGPPQDELPHSDAHRAVSAPQPQPRLMVKSAEVFRTGCLFEVSWIIRRHEENDEEWSILHSSVFQHGPVRGVQATRTCSCCSALNFLMAPRPEQLFLGWAASWIPTINPKRQLWRSAGGWWQRQRRRSISIRKPLAVAAAR